MNFYSGCRPPLDDRCDHLVERKLEPQKLGDGDRQPGHLDVLPFDPSPTLNAYWTKVQ